MNINSSNFKSSFILEEHKPKPKYNHTKSSSMITNNYSIYEKYIGKNSLYKSKSRNKDNSLRKSNSLTFKHPGKNLKSQSSFNLSNIESDSKIKKNKFSSFSQIMENCFQQKKKEISKKASIRKNFSRNYKQIIVEINSGNSGSNSYHKKSNTGVNVISQHLNQLNKKKFESKNIKTTRNRNLSMREIDNISYLISSQNTNNNSNKNKTQKENINVRKFFEPKKKKITKILPSNNNNFKNSNLKNRNYKSNSLKKNNVNNSDNEIEKKYNLLLNSNYSSENKTSRNTLIKGPNYNTYKSGESEVTKPGTLNTKIEKEKKEDELEGPELIHFSIVGLIQKGRKKMEEITKNIKRKNNKK